MVDDSVSAYKILIVDDTRDFRITLGGFLGDVGYDVRLAENEGKALDLITQESFDFALVDVRLHGDDEDDESGLSLAMAIRKLNPRIHVIMLARYPRAKQVVRAIRYHGIDDYIEKSPDVGDQVLKAIEAISQEDRHTKFREIPPAIRLSLSLTANQPLMIRARGQYVCAVHTSKTLQIDIERYAKKTEIARRDPTNLMFQIREIGEQLWKDVFSRNSEIERVYREARSKGELIDLSIEAPREFLGLPVELLRPDVSEYLVLEHPISRFVSGASPKREAISPELLALNQELGILLIGSNTVPPIDGADTEVQALYAYLDRQDCITVNLKFIPTEEATCDRIRAELAECRYDIVHYAGHGLYASSSPQESCLYFWSRENKQGNVMTMTATELRLLLGRSRTRLVYLSCCYGAATGSKSDLLQDDFLGLADAIVHAGVPSVLGFRWPISDKEASKMALAFYGSLLRQGSPAIALWDARYDLATQSMGRPTWLSPILIHQE